MTRLVGFVLSALVFLIISNKAFASAWYYPMDKIPERAMLKGFGVLVNGAFYKGREELFPNRFYGYHAGQDLESLSFEKQNKVLVPFYAVSDGTIIYIGKLSGYGGVILEKLSDGTHTALYGHVKLPSNIRVGDVVKAGQRISYLGDDFSGETSGERKHLHFALHKDTNQYFHGHETSLNIINNQWEDPIPFLKSRQAVSLDANKISPTPRPVSNVKKPAAGQNFFESFFSFVLRLFKKS